MTTFWKHVQPASSSFRGQGIPFVRAVLGIFVILTSGETSASICHPISGSFAVEEEFFSKRRPLGALAAVCCPIGGLPLE